MSTVSEKLKIISDALEKIRKVLVRKGFFTDNIYPNITEYADYIDNWNGVNVTDLINYVERKTDMPGYIANGLTRPVGGQFKDNSFITTFEANDMTTLRGGYGGILTTRGEEEYFENCTNLRSIKMNAYEHYYGSSDYGLINNCDSLVNIEMNSLIDGNYYQSGDYSFGPLVNNCDALQSIELPALQEWGKARSANIYFIKDCKGLTSVSLPVCKELSSRAFYGCTNLKTINAPMLEKIGGSPFAECPNIEYGKCDLFPNLKEIGKGGYENVFSGSNSNYLLNEITEVNIPNLEIVRGRYPIYNMKMLNRVVLPKLMEIYLYSDRSYFLAECPSLENLSFPKLTYMEASFSFENDYMLKTVDMPSLETLAYSYYYGSDSTMFYHTQVKNLNLPNLTEIKSLSTSISNISVPVFGGMITLSMPNLVSIVGQKPLRAGPKTETQNGQNVWKDTGTVSKTGWNNYTANSLETIDIYYYSPFYYESSLTWVDFPALREIICRSTTAPSSLFLNTGLKRFWLPKDTIKTITAQTLTQAPFYNLGDDFEIWTDFASEEELNAENVSGGSINFGQYWANISSDKTATIQYGKTHEEYREEVATLDGGTVKPEFGEVTE